VRVHVGTCGFSYKDWIGPFYPHGMKSPDMLEFYAEHFDAVEIDSTYYAVPKPQLFTNMAARTPPAFRFTVKAPGSITHVPADSEPPADDVRLFREALSPLLASKKLGAVLAQFPHAFRPNADAYRRLEQVREWWPDLSLVAEFRHREWQQSDAVKRLRELDVGWCNVDEPAFKTLLRPSADVTSSIGYVRFHGRNYDKWWKQERASHERYSYLYGDEELQAWAPRIADVAQEAEETFVFFNNHHLGRAAQNATEMSAILRPLMGPPLVPKPRPEQPRLL